MNMAYSWKHDYGGKNFVVTDRRWQDVKINIGVMGRSGVGKSSFINALRG
jgi:predicted GTPase